MSASNSLFTAPDPQFIDLGVIKMSKSVVNLFKALNEAQGKLETVQKTNDVDMGQGRAKYKYAELSDVQDAIRSAYRACGLHYSQWLHGDGITTLVGHTSGEWVMGTLAEAPIKMRAEGPQDYGSFTTYLRRYHLAAVTGVAQEDDDGIYAQKTATTQKPSGNPSPILTREANTTHSSDDASKASAPQIHKPTTPLGALSPAKPRIVASRSEELKALCLKRGWSPELSKEYMKVVYGIKETSDELTDDQYKKFVTTVSTKTYSQAMDAHWEPPEPPMGGFPA